MNARGETSVFWPGITNQIIEVRAKCENCNRMAPSQPLAPLATQLLIQHIPFSASALTTSNTRDPTTSSLKTDNLSNP